jgi:hypothetical protein
VRYYDGSAEWCGACLGGRPAFRTELEHDFATCAEVVLQHDSAPISTGECISIEKQTAPSTETHPNKRHAGFNARRMQLQAGDMVPP